LTGTSPTVTVTTTTVGALPPASVNAIQTITFGGTITGGTFTLNYSGTPIGPITYSTDPAVLTANIQAALTTALGAGNTLVAAVGNTYGGATIVDAGALQVENALALAGSSGTQVLDGAQLQMQTPVAGPQAGQSVVISGEQLTLSGTGIFGTGALLDTGGNNTWQGPIIL